MSSLIYDSELLTHIFDTVDIGVAVCNAKNNRLESVNNTFAKIHGYEQQELLGVAPKDVFAPDCIAKLNEYEQKLNREANTLSFETVHFKKDGTPVKISAHFTLLKNDKGEVQKRVANIIDISSCKNKKCIFQDTNSKLEAIFSTIPDMVWMKDPNGKYMASNHTFHKVFGKSEREIIGKTDYDFFSQEEADSCKISDLEAVSAKETIICQEIIAYPNSDKKGILEIRKTPVYDSANNLMGILGIARDITERKKAEEQLRMVNTAINTTSEAIYITDSDLSIIHVNDGACNMLGYTKDEFLSMNVSDIDAKNSKDEIVDIKKDITATHQIVFETKHKRKDGSIIDVEITGSSFIFEGKSVRISVVKDITERKNFEERLAIKQEELKIQKEFQDTLLKGIAKAGMSVNVVENGKYIYTNNLELAKEYGYDDHFLENKPDFLETIHPDDKAKVANMHKKRLAGEEVPTTYTIRQINKKGETKEHEVSVVLIPNTNPVQTLVVNKDVTEQKNIEKRIEFMAHHDILTGLPNRVLLKDRAEVILSQAKRNIKKAAFLFIDLDGFKTINDSLGHSIGDIILKSVAQRIQSCIRATDTLSRYGGDEFIVIIPEVNNQDEAELVTEKIINEFKKSFEINNQLLSITASVGIAIYPEHGNNFEHLLQNSDAAMYKAKENGKNTYCFFTQQMKHNLLGIFKMQNDLKEAIRKKEFILHYQPQIDLSNNKIVGVEALIRWEHPSMGMIPPMNFISVAESCGYIVEIGEWVINEACNQCAIWNKNGKNIVVAVNVSAVQFKRGNLIEVVKNALMFSGLNPKYLELELTESILISDTDNVLQSIQAIKELGVQLSIDDFGTGYSSLAYLKRFAVDKLKIDQSFVRDIVKDKEDASIVKTIIQMAKSFNLKSIAEGVENEEVLNVLKEFGCDEVQGYHFAKPMVASDFRDYYKNLQKKRII